MINSKADLFAGRYQSAAGIEGCEVLVCEFHNVPNLCFVGLVTLSILVLLVIEGVVVIALLLLLAELRAY